MLNKLLYIILIAIISLIIYNKDNITIKTNKEVNTISSERLDHLENN